jgi:hypothetical protein
VSRDLTEDVGGGPEAVETEPLSVTAHPEGAVSDQARAQQRCCLQVRVAIWQRETEPLVGHAVFRHPAVPVASSELCELTEVLVASSAELTRPTGEAEPRDPDPAAVGDAGGDDLVAEDARGSRHGHLAIHQVQVGATDPAGEDAQEHLSAARLGDGQIDQREGLTHRLEHHRAHRSGRG